MAFEIMSRAEKVAGLKELVGQTGSNNEVACGKLLEDPELASVLLPLNSTLVFTHAELRTSSGDVDLLVAADETLPGGTKMRRLFVWELKAPQASLFHVETKGRARPSHALYSAENQLFHYHAKLAGSEADRKPFGVLAAEDVRLGGVIIGTSESFVVAASKVSDSQARMLADTARDVREKVIYRPNAMSLFTWTMVVKNLEVIRSSHREYVGQSGAVLTLATGSVVDDTVAEWPESDPNS